MASIELSRLSSRSRMEERLLLTREVEEVLAVVAEASWLDGAVRDEADQREEEAEEEEAGAGELAGGSFLKLVEAGEEVPAQQQPQVHTHSSKDQPALRRCSSIARAPSILARDDPVSSDRDSPRAIPPPAAVPTLLPPVPLHLNPPLPAWESKPPCRPPASASVPIPP